MTNEELAGRIQQGQAELMAQLWAQIEAFVRCRARDAMQHIPQSHGATEEDLAQSGYLALCSAVETYDPDRSSFLTWLDYYLQSEFAAVGGYRGTKRRPLDDALSLDAPIQPSEADEAGTLMDVVAATHPGDGDDYAEVEEAIYQEQLHTVLDHAIGKLPEEQADVLRARYWQGQRRGDIARAKGVSVERLRRAERAGLYALRAPALSGELSRFLDERVNYYSSTGVRAFQRTGTSSVERIVLERDRLREEWLCRRKEAK